MRALYLDGQAGAAGDMILAALIDLGLDTSTLHEFLRPIVPADFELKVESVQVYGIAAKRLSVTVSEDVKHRHLAQVLALLDRGSMSPWVKQRVSGVFHRLAEAEARIHSSTLEGVHFHEVGANDAIIDIAGSIWGIEALGVQKVLAAPLVLGSGVGKSAHGPIHYPAPAVLEILKDLPVIHAGDLGETTTPTGAAILAEVAEFDSPVTMVTSRIGYGAGHRSLADRPNLLRASLGEMAVPFDTDTLWLGTSDIDNTRPEIFPWLEERLRDGGAVDVIMSAISMKKGRIGTRVEVLCDPTMHAKMAEIILTETGSLGVRWTAVHRTKLRRRQESVETPWGAIRVKVAESPNGPRAIPEYEDCREAASRSGVPLATVIETVTRLYHEQLKRG